LFVGANVINAQVFPVILSAIFLPPEAGTGYAAYFHTKV